MQKQNIFHDNDYCRLLSMCIAYKCPYGVNTLVSDIVMAENMMGISKLNVSTFDNNEEEENIGGDFDE